RAKPAPDTGGKSKCPDLIGFMPASCGSPICSIHASAPMVPILTRSCATSSCQIAPWYGADMTDKERAEFLEQHAKRTAIHYRQLAAKLTRYANQLEDPHAMEDRFPQVAVV